MHRSAAPARRRPFARALLALALALTAAACKDGGGTGTPPNPTPGIGALSPAEAAQGTPTLVVTITGSDFARGAVARLDGSDRATQYVSRTELRATLSEADFAAPGMRQVTVFNPAPGGGTSNGAAFAVIELANPFPLIGSLEPAFVAAGSGETRVSVHGSGFVPQSRVFQGQTAKPTEYVSPSQLRVTLSAAELAGGGTLQLRVVSPAPGGGASPPVSFEVRTPVPTLASLAVDHGIVETPSLELRVNGTGFVANSQVRFNGSARPTRMVSPTQLEATLGAADLSATGSFQVTVHNPAPGGGASAPAAFEVRNPAPAITSLGTAQATAGEPSLELRVNGTGFVPASEVRFNGSARPTRRVSPTVLEVTLGEGDLRTAGSFEITVRNPAPGGGTSGAAALALVNGAPTLALLPSRGAAAGGAGFTLVVHGAGFVEGSVVRWNGAERPTQYLGAARLAVNVPAGDVAAAGSAQVTVHNPAPGGGTSAALSFQVRTLPSTAVTGAVTVALAARDLAWDPRTGRLYASIPGSAPQHGNSVVAIDPATGAVTGAAFVGSEPGALALSHDGRWLHVALDGSSSVRRVAVATLTPGLEFSLNGLAVEEMEAVPGEAGTVAVALMNRNTSPRHNGVCVYDDGVRRAQCTPGHIGSNSIEFGADGTVLYGYDNESSEAAFRTMRVSGAGAQVTRVQGGLVETAYGRIHHAAGRVYSTWGVVVDAERGVRMGVMGGGMQFQRMTAAVAPELGRAFFLTEGGQIEVYDLNTFTPLGAVSAGPVNSDHPALRRVRLVRWGTDGLAFVDGEKIRILRTPIAGG